jgi:hypothetical protein
MMISTLPPGTLGSVPFLLATILYQENLYGEHQVLI